MKEQTSWWVSTLSNHPHFPRNQGEEPDIDTTGTLLNLGSNVFPQNLSIHQEKPELPWHLYKSDDKAILCTRNLFIREILMARSSRWKFYQQNTCWLELNEQWCNIKELTPYCRGESPTYFCPFMLTRLLYFKYQCCAMTDDTQTAPPNSNPTNKQNTL